MFKYRKKASKSKVLEKSLDAEVPENKTDADLNVQSPTTSVKIQKNKKNTKCWFSRRGTWCGIRTYSLLKHQAYQLKILSKIEATQESEDQETVPIIEVQEIAPTPEVILPEETHDAALNVQSPSDLNKTEEIQDVDFLERSPAAEQNAPSPATSDKTEELNQEDWRPRVAMV